MTGQNGLRLLLYDKTNQRKIEAFYLGDLFPQKVTPDWADGSSLVLRVGDVIRNVFHMSSKCGAGFCLVRKSGAHVDDVQIS